MILCGGCAQNEAIIRYVEDCCQSALEGKVEVVVTEDPWPAATRGAVLQQLFPEMLKGKKSPVSVGFIATVPFVEGLHSEDDAYYCSVRGKRADNHIQFLIHKVR